MKTVALASSEYPQLLKSLSSNTASTELNIGQNDSYELRKPEDLKTKHLTTLPNILGALAANTTVEDLSLKDQGIESSQYKGDKTLEPSVCGQKLLELISQNTSLKRIDLRLNFLGADRVGVDGTIAKDGSDKNKDSEFVKEFSQALTKNTTLTELNLGHNLFRNDGAIALAQALRGNTTLTSLNLPYNQLDSEGIVALAEMLKTNTTLTKLELSGNKIGEKGAAALKEMLETNTTLTSLVIVDVGLEKKDLDFLTTAVARNAAPKNAATDVSQAFPLKRSQVKQISS